MKDLYGVLKRMQDEKDAHLLHSPDSVEEPPQYHVELKRRNMGRMLRKLLGQNENVKGLRFVKEDDK